MSGAIRITQPGMILPRRGAVAVVGAPSIQVAGTGLTRTVTITGATGGTWDCTVPTWSASSYQALEGSAFAWNISTALLQGNLKSNYRIDSGFALSGGTLTVAGTAGSSYVITFQEDPGAMTVNGAGLV